MEKNAVMMAAAEVAGNARTTRIVWKEFVSVRRWIARNMVWNADGGNFSVAVRLNVLIVPAEKPAMKMENV
jgi:hypothetical protein